MNKTMTYKERRNLFGFKCHKRASKSGKNKKKSSQEYKVIRSDGVNDPYIYRLKVDANSVAASRQKELPLNSPLIYNVVKIK